MTCIPNNFARQKLFLFSVSEDDLDTLSTRLKMDFDPYVEQTVEALTTMTETQETFQYHMKRQRDNVEFVWKKHIPAEDITVRSFLLVIRGPDKGVLMKIL